MTSLAPSQLITSLKARYATKVFDNTRTVPAETLSALEASLVLTPSSFGLQPWKFIVVRDKALREKLLPHSWNQPQVVDCSHLVVFARRDTTGTADIERFIADISAARSIPAEALSGYKDMMSGFVAQHPDLADWAAHQVYIAMGQFLTSCAVLGVDACPMEGITPAKYDEILGLAGSGYSTVVACPIGYRSANDKYATLAKVRRPASEVIEHR